MGTLPNLYKGTAGETWLSKMVPKLALSTGGYVTYSAG
jgi:hypothetical protein